MPTVEKVSGGRVLVRGIGRFDIGDRAEVSDDEAAYLCEERGDFVRVGEDDAGEDADADTETCDVVKNDGEVCGRDLPCPYHSDDEED